ncbi:hypothetical protein BDV97DRAFT_402788 [Delphinella strobiligena]|nr:hypothetical protein BDV97DRAFT_402788 [Delphinella strobiligena]
MRFHKPAGLLGLYLPYTIALFFAASMDRGSRLAPAWTSRTARSTHSKNCRMTKAGIKSMGMRFHHVAPFLSVLILAKALFLIVAGVITDLNIGFFTAYLFAVFGARMLYRLNINDPNSCG